MISEIMTWLSFRRNSIAIFLLAFVFFSWNLGGQQYSLDEPETIIVARSIAQHALPSSWDGKNFVSINNGADSIRIGNIYVWQWHPWIQHYLTYFYLTLTDSLSPQTLRLPFVFLGAICPVLVYQIAKNLFRKTWIGWLLALQSIFSVPFYLYVRQVRYYGISTLFSLLVFYLLLQLKPKNRVGKYVPILITSLLLFLTNYFSGIGTMLFTLCWGVRRKDFDLILVGLIEMIIALIWYLVLKPFGGNALLFQAFLTAIPNILHNLSYINTWIFPVILLPFLILIKKKEHLFMLLFWLFLKVGLVSFFLLPHGRFLIETFPFWFLLFGYLYTLLDNFKIPFVALVIAGFSILHPLSGKPISELFAESTQSYPSALQALGAYIGSQAVPGDLFWSNSYNLPLYLYSSVPTISPVCKNGKIDGPSSVIDPHQIRWFIFFSDGRLAQSLSQVNCFGETWQKKLETEYRRFDFQTQTPSYLPNDPDIVNRQYPPAPIKSREITIYEKKGS